MAMFYPSVEHAMTIFCVVSLNYNLIHVSVAGRGVQTARLNKRTGCESPRCRHCKCRDGLPLVKASHWRIPRRQTGRRSRHKSGDLRKQTAAALPRELGGDGRFSAQKNGCGGLLFWTAAAVLHYIWKCRKRCIMPTPSRNAIYDATIRRMTACALEEAENRFAVEHAQDTEQQLADYLRKYADELGHTPWPREIPGGMTIQTRFGSWEAAVAEAGLPFPEHPNQPGKFRRVREETQRQRAIYRQKKAEKRKRAKERMKAQEEKRRKNRQSGIT